MKIVDCPNSASCIACLIIAGGIAAGCGGVEKVEPVVEKPVVSDAPYDAVPGLIGLLEEAAENGDVGALKRAAADLAGHMDPRGMNAVKNALGKERNCPYMRAVLLEALGEYSNPDVLPLIRSFENDSEEMVKDVAFAVIQRICPVPGRLKEILRKKKKNRNRFIRVVIASLQSNGEHSDLAAGMFRLRLLKMAAATEELLVWDERCLESLDGRSARGRIDLFPLFRLDGVVSVKGEGDRTSMRVRLLILDEKDSIRGGAGARAALRGGVYPPILRDLSSSLSESAFEDIAGVISR